MRFNAYIIALFLFFILTITEASAQVSGYQGKRFILSVDPAALIYQNGIVVGFDYVVTRNVAFSVSYNRSNRSHTQRIAAYKQAWGVFPEDKGTILDNQLGVEIEYYPNQSFPAPKGSYLFANYFQGIATATGDIYFHRLGPDLEDYQIEGIRTSTISVGVGNKSIVKDLLVFEFNFGITLGNLNIPENTESSAEMSFQSFTDQYGPNLYSFGELAGNGGMGLSIGLKFGFLLF